MFSRSFRRSNFSSIISPLTLTSNSTIFKPSIFTGKADFYETLYFLDDILLKVKDFNSTCSSVIEFNWLNREKLQNKLGFEMSLLEYRQIRQRLVKIQPASSYSQNVFEFLRVFGDAVRTTETSDPDGFSLSNELELKKESSLGWIDELNRTIAIGRRKSSTAKIMLVPGTGEFRVNGKALVYFPKPRDIYFIAKPFQVTEQFGKFNVWALVKGGGYTGQSGAITLGLAKALAVYNPEFKEALNVIGSLRRDPRRVERKKPGQEKARKKFTWVKR